MGQVLPSLRACGFVLVRPAPRSYEYLLLTNKNRGEAGLPKGHADEGETELATALRETEEETGLTDVVPDLCFRRTLTYPARRKGQPYQKTVVYLLAHLRSGRVRLSHEHSDYRWVPLGTALSLLPFTALAQVVREAALYLKDSALFDLERADEVQADLHLRSLPQADERLVAHLRGGARLARDIARGLARAGLPVHIEAAATGTLLHDVGRALGDHEDHQLAGLKHLRRTPLAPYGFACISHFTKGATPQELRDAGVSSEQVERFRHVIDLGHLSWEERCAALADACMMGPTPVTPAERFADLRRRYDAPLLIDLQERRTEELRAEISQVTGRDPLAVLDLV